MAVIKNTNRIVAATPIQVGEWRLLPSVMVKTLVCEHPELPELRSVRIRPISLVEEGPEGTRWHAIPDKTGESLGVMMVLGLVVAFIAGLVIFLSSLAE